MPPFSFNSVNCHYRPDKGRLSRTAFDLAAAPIMRTHENWRALKFSHLERGAQASSDGVYHVACQACPKEDFCRAARINLSEFEPTPSQQKKFEFYKNYTSLTVRPASSLDQEIYELYQKYIGVRHADAATNMLDYDYDDLRKAYARNALLLLARAKNNVLMAVSILDQHESNYSAEYQIYDMDEKHMKISPGISMTLTSLLYMKEQNPNGYMYFGTWSPGSPKLGYKSGFKGFEIYTEDGWVPCDKKTPATELPPPYKAPILNLR